jgi:hypothetical protein
MLPTQCLFIWPNGFRGEESKKNSILHAYVVSEKKIIKNFSQSEAFMAPGSHVG